MNMIGVFLLYPRSGSHFIMRTLTGQSDLVDKDLLIEKDGKACLETVSISYLPETKEEALEKTSHIFIQYAFETRPDLSVPQDGALFTPDAIRSLPSEWKFVYVIRDGRDQIESYWHLIAYGAKKRGEVYDRWDLDNIKYSSSLFKQRARRVIDCSQKLKNYTIVRFEDLVSKPVSTLDSALSFCGFTPDLSQIRDTVQRIIPNSSYSSTENVTRRSRNWPKEWNDAFWEIAGKESLQLGYHP